MSNFFQNLPQVSMKDIRQALSREVKICAEKYPEWVKQGKKSLEWYQKDYAAKNMAFSLLSVLLRDEAKRLKERYLNWIEQGGDFEKIEFEEVVGIAKRFLIIPQPSGIPFLSEVLPDEWKEKYSDGWQVIDLLNGAYLDGLGEWATIEIQDLQTTLF